ncbi:MAG: HNH endonuclease [Verrucomicrobiales bacterium]
MARKRLEFSDRQKAEIFVRDRATCCFSGANLWLLDEFMRPEMQIDWVDHVIPAAHGGGNELENGVCAAHRFNAKMRQNVADRSYLFRDGIPTEFYHAVFGPLPERERNRLRRLAKLEWADWYFNRSLAWILQAFERRCITDFYADRYRRGFDYWVSAAYRKLLSYQKYQTGESLEARGIVVQPAQIEATFLTLRNAASHEEFVAVCEGLFPAYRRNFLAWSGYFWNSETREEMASAYEAAVADPQLCEKLRETIQSHHAVHSLSHS